MSANDASIRRAASVSPRSICSRQRLLRGAAAGRRSPRSRGGARPCAPPAPRAPPRLPPAPSARAPRAAAAPRPAARRRSSRARPPRTRSGPRPRRSAASGADRDGASSTSRFCCARSRSSLQPRSRSSTRRVVATNASASSAPAARSRSTNSRRRSSAIRRSSSTSVRSRAFARICAIRDFSSAARGDASPRRRAHRVAPASPPADPRDAFPAGRAQECSERPVRRRVRPARVRPVRPRPHRRCPTPMLRRGAGGGARAGRERGRAPRRCSPPKRTRGTGSSSVRSRSGDGGRTWLALRRPAASPSADRLRVRDAVSIIALCELADETAGGGDLDELRAQLAALADHGEPAGDRGGGGGGARARSGCSAPRRRSRRRPGSTTIGAATLRLELALGSALHGSPVRRGDEGAPATSSRRSPARSSAGTSYRLDALRAGTLAAWKGAASAFPFGGDPEELLRGLQRVRRAAGRVGAGGAARAVRDADAEHGGRADRRGAEAGSAERRGRRAGGRAPRRDARALPRGGGARAAPPARASCASRASRVRSRRRGPARPRDRPLLPAVPKPARAAALVPLHRRRRRSTTRGASSRELNAAGQVGDGRRARRGDRASAGGRGDRARRTWRCSSAIERDELDANVSVKPTGLGLKLDYELCRATSRRSIAARRAADRFVRIDMEDSSTTDDTLGSTASCATEGHDNVGVVLQASLGGRSPTSRVARPAAERPALQGDLHRARVDRVPRRRRRCGRASCARSRRSSTAAATSAIATHDEWLVDARRR